MCDLYLRSDGSGFDTVLYIKTTASGTSGWATVPMYWTRSGSYLHPTNTGDYVGIGTTSPDYKLQVDGAVAPETGYTSDLGAYLKKWLTIHAAELRVETLVATDTMATIGGRINVAPTTQLTSDLTDSATTIYVKHNNLAENDILRLEADGKVEWMSVNANGGPTGGGPFAYVLTRNLDGTGANTWASGDAVLNTGTFSGGVGDGYIDLYSDRSTRNPTGTQTHYGPTIVGNVRTGTGYSNLEERWAIGNLRGVFGYTTDTYGSAFGSPTGSWVKIDPTNGVRIGHNETTNLRLEADGDAWFAGQITSTSGAIGAWQIGPTYLVDSNSLAGMSAAVTGANDVRFFAGSSTPTAAPFRVYEDGTAVVSGLTVTGLGGNILSNSEFRYGFGEGAGSGESWRAGANTTGQTWTSG